MTIQEFRDYMASGKPVVGGGDVHMIFHQQTLAEQLGMSSFRQRTSSVPTAQGRAHDTCQRTPLLVVRHASC